MIPILLLLIFFILSRFTNILTDVITLYSFRRAIIMNIAPFLFALTCVRLTSGREEIPTNSTPAVDLAENQDFKFRIVGGDAVVNRAEFYYQVSIRRDNSHFCGGTIIDSKHVLTAAHCVVNGDTVTKPSAIRVVVGDLNIYTQTEQTISRTVSHIFTHEYYNGDTIVNDIAILRVSKEFEWSSYVNSITQATTRPIDNTYCNVSGWGATSENGYISDSLQYVSIPIVSTRICRSQYGDTVITDGMLCAAYESGGKDSCQGDSGGPLVCNNELVGIVSWGYGCAQPGYSGVYTDVAAYRNWTYTQIARSSTYVPSISLSCIVFTTIFNILVYNF